MPKQWPASRLFDASDVGRSTALPQHLADIFPNARRRNNTSTGWSSMNHCILCTVLRRKDLMKKEIWLKEAGKAQRRRDLVRHEGTDWDELQEESEFPCKGIWPLLRNASPVNFRFPSCFVPGKQEQQRPAQRSWSSKPSWAISSDGDHDCVLWWVFKLEVMVVTAK